MFSGYSGFRQVIIKEIYTNCPTDVLFPLTAIYKINVQGTMLNLNTLWLDIDWSIC